MALTIALTYNPKRDPTPDQPRDFYAEFDAEFLETINLDLLVRRPRYVVHTDGTDYCFDL